MPKAIGMVEYFNVSKGVKAADIMAKTADVEILTAMTVCPGKYIVIVAGALSAVKASVEAAKKNVPEKLADSFVLGNPHEDIFPAIYGATEVGNVAALGILETYTASLHHRCGRCCGEDRDRQAHRSENRKGYERKVIYVHNGRDRGGRGGDRKGEGSYSRRRHIS